MAARCLEKGGFLRLGKFVEGACKRRHSAGRSAHNREKCVMWHTTLLRSRAVVAKSSTTRCRCPVERRQLLKAGLDQQVLPSSLWGRDKMPPPNGLCATVS